MAVKVKDGKLTRIYITVKGIVHVFEVGLYEVTLHIRGQCIINSRGRSACSQFGTTDRRTPNSVTQILHFYGRTPYPSQKWKKLSGPSLKLSIDNSFSYQYEVNT